MRGSPFLMPVYGVGWLFGRGVRFREAVGCIAAGVGALPLGAGVWWPVREVGRWVPVCGGTVKRQVW